jgi:hypothetical protein
MRVLQRALRGIPVPGVSFESGSLGRYGKAGILYLGPPASASDPGRCFEAAQAKGRIVRALRPLEGSVSLASLLDSWLFKRPKTRLAPSRADSETPALKAAWGGSSLGDATRFELSSDGHRHDNRLQLNRRSNWA